MRDRLWLHGREMPTHEVEIDWGTGAVHVIRRAALGDQPPYRERWFMYVEDLDLCWRLRQRGWHVLLTGDIEVTHIGNVSGRKAFGMTREARYWQATYDWVRLERGPLAARLAAMANTFAEGIRLVGSAISVAMRRRAKTSLARRWVTLRTHARAAVIGPRPPGHPSLADADDSRALFVPPPGA
jgi:GT2 family glycosyltransferase